MTNSRDMAEQAFSLLQNALEASESRRLDLEEQLNTSRPPASEIEQAYDSLLAEFERVRTERDLWKKSSRQLQDVVSNERSKAKRLTKKLRVIESGTDRVTRKEVNFWREKAAGFEAAKQEFQQRIHELKAQLSQRDEQDDAIKSNEVRSEELDSLRSLLESRDSSVAELSASLENSKLHSDAQDLRIAELDTEVRRLSEQVIDAEAARNDACRATDLMDAELKDLRAQASAHQQDVETAQQQVDKLGDLNQEYQRRIDELETQHELEIAALREEHCKDIAAASEQHQQVLAEAHAEAVDASKERFEAQLSELTEQLEARVTQYAELEQVNGTLTNSVEELQTAKDDFAARIAILEGELAEERHRSDNLNELANERRETLSRTTEKLEEMEERYEDAKWQLGKTRHFERLVRRRRKLIANLIETIRARQKANTTLKAGIDSLRRYKANADERQQELLRRVETLENSLSEAREKAAQSNQSRRASDAEAAESSIDTAITRHSEQTSVGGTDASELRDKVLLQAEAIEHLETDLRNARIAESEARTRLRELEKLHEDIETKNTFIDSLQVDLEAQQNTLAQLRKLEIEVRELRDYIQAQDRKMVALKEENGQLRSAKSGEVDSIDKQRIEEQQELIERLSTKLREYEDTITTLSEAADSWKRKYDFLAGETPYGYESASSE